MKGILFKPDMHKVIREGRKTVTRRVIKASNSTVCGYCYKATDPTWAGLVWSEKVFVDKGPHILHPYKSSYLHVPYIEPNGEDDGRVFRVRSRLEVDEVVYIKEGIQKHGDGAHYILDGKIVMFFLSANPFQWRWERDTLSPMFLPHEAARDFIQITDVRAERLQEITEGDAIKEGFSMILGNMDRPTTRWYFKNAWDSINKAYPWESNPWVWRYEFEKVEAALV